TSGWQHQFSADGAMSVRVSVSVEPALPPLPRIGVQFKLAQDVEEVTWLGRGPHENYPDRLVSADYGRWRLPTKDMHTDYVFPSENGLRCDTTELQINDMRITGLLHFSVSRFGQTQLNTAQHTCDLVEQEGLYVYLDGKHMGVGGDDSWTPSTKSRYLLADSRYQWGFMLV
ncbi:MAG: beta-galactosidase, partial [Gammaproteobacteria bacterium TMED92]